MPQRPDQYQTLAEFAKVMTLAKLLQAIPQTAQVPPEAVRNLAGAADRLFLDLRRAGWGPQHAPAINQFAAERLDQPGEGALLMTTVAGSHGNNLLLQLRGTDKRIVVPVDAILSKSSPGTNWLVIGLVTSRTAQVRLRGQTSLERVPVVSARYMLKVR
jgi:hypothetical protein